MPHSVEAVEREGRSSHKLEASLRREWQRAERSGQGGRVEVPAEHRGGEVGKAKEVERHGDSEAGDAVERGQDPGYLWLVDGEVGRGGTEFALCDQDLGAIVDGDFLGCYGSVKWMSVGVFLDLTEQVERNIEAEKQDIARMGLNDKVFERAALSWCIVEGSSSRAFVLRALRYRSYPQRQQHPKAAFTSAGSSPLECMTSVSKGDDERSAMPTLFGSSKPQPWAQPTC